jgi:hypothetical protein
MTPMANAGKGAYEGVIKGLPVALAVRGAFFNNPAAQNPQTGTYLS